MLLKIVNRLIPSVPQYRIGFARTRNFFPVEPFFPEQTEKPIYRPIYENRTKAIKTPRQVYQLKIDSIVERAKKSAKLKFVTAAPTTLHDALNSKEKKGKLVEQFMDNLVIDEDTGVPVGMGFDEFIRIVKNRRAVQTQSKYIDNIGKIIKHLSLYDEADLAALNKHLLAEAYKGDYLQKARVKLVKNLTQQINHYKDQNRISAILNQNLDMSKHSKEFVMAALREGDHSKIDQLLNESVTSDIARSLAFQDIDTKVSEYKKLINTKNAQKTSLEQYVKDPYYHSPMSNTDDSDYERLTGEKEPRRLKGDEIYQTANSIRLDENINIIKRNYFRNKRAHLLTTDEQTQQPTDEIDKLEQLKQFLSINEKEEAIYFEADSVNLDADTSFTFKEIYDRIDYFLKGAPQFIKEMTESKEDCDNKPFYPQILQADLKQTQMLWNDFSSNYQTLFPTTNRTPSKDPASLTRQDKDLLQQEQLFAVELYKEFSQPQNEQFFRHYIVNDLKFFNQQNEHQLQRIIEGTLGTLVKEDYKNFMLLPDDDIPETDEDLDGDDKVTGLQGGIEEDIFQQYNDAANIPYYGKGKRKSCRVAVKITKGQGLVTVNDKPFNEYLTQAYYRSIAMFPLTFTGLACYIDVAIWVRGSGPSSQADAMSNAIARGMIKLIPGLKRSLRKLNLTKTDPRVVERKKPGLYKARKKWPYARR